MATSRRRTAKKDVGQNLGELESRVKKVERRPRASIGSFSITSDLIAPGSITIDKLDPALLALLQDIADNAGSAGDSSEYIVSGGEDGDGLVTGVVDSVISQYDFSTTSASGKNSIYWQSTEPTGGEYADGDIWYDTSLSPVDNLPQYTPHRYNASIPDWEPAEFGDGAFRFIDAGKISTGILDAGIAIRVGTYPLDAAAVGKSRVEIASTFPTRQAAVGEDPATIPTFSGIRVLRKTAAEQTETSGFYPSLLINADSGNFRVGSATRYLSYTASTDKVILSGTILTGADENGNATSESLLIGTDVSTPLGETDGKDGIRLGPYNYWYRPNSVTGSTSLIFKVGSSGNEGLTVTKGGAVNFEGTANPTGGVIKGKLSIRAVAGAVDRIEIGQNVLSNRDGFRIDNNNHWTVSNTGGSTAFSVGSSTKQLTYDTVSGLLKLTGGDITLTGGGSFKTSDGNTRVEMNSNGIFGYTGGTKTFWVDAATGDSSFEGTTNPTGGTVKGKLTIQGTTYAFGKNVMSVRDGLYLNANNYWTLSQTGATAQFKVGGASKYVEWTGGALNISGDITSSTFTGGTIRTAASGSRVEMADSGTVNNVWSNDGTIGNFSANDRIAFYSGSTVENVPGYIRTLFGDTAVSQLQIFGPSSTTWGNTSGGVLPPSIKLQNGVGLTGSNRPAIYISVSYLNGLVQTSASEIQLITEDLNFFSTDPVVSGVLVGTTPTYVLGLNASGQLKKYSSVGGSGGYSNATDGTTTNKITYGGSPPGTGTGRSAGDIHIEF